MKNTYKYILSFVLVMVCTMMQAQPNIHPADKQSKSIKIEDAIIHIGNGDYLDNATVVFDNGIITYVGTKSNAPEAQQTINASGKHVYPGFITPNTNLGLVEFEAVKATLDFAEVGENNAHVRSLIAYNTDSKLINTIRTNGILHAQITPKTGLISGQSSIVHLDAWNWEDAVVKEDDGVHINWPSISTRRTLTDSAKKRMIEQNEKQIEKLKTLFKEAEAYARLDANDKVINARLQALEGVFNKDKKVFIHVNNAKEIQKAILTFVDLGIKPIIIGGIEAHLVTDILKQYEIPVIIRHSHSLPSKEHEDVYLPYKQANLLYEAGILAAYSVDGNDAFWDQRNLPFIAGTAVAHGLPYEQAVAFISFNTAKILGIEEVTGSIEVGKSADLFISEGDALDMMSNDITRAFIQGRDIDLDNWHKQLYYRYKEKYKASNLKE